ncbi:hypothetical protein DFA_06087 [Cavenderia fasciculata]|uniref:Monalysin Pore-forming domain-containing protein n=1 Tax=Cavenderia fasciculata TaxID=261658 RepID=F4PK25_CACFS|nr:uncharacterized protein DFA_06087 [Cavenderia fasciculata]EGG23949.1 hypothetical protein DFA_06087 [Cavenderia fasciculata]|eukprot:XP_004361800.1 hypothetical protein DFA_06087 [Cavenderia fasciculata]
MEDLKDIGRNVDCSSFKPIPKGMVSNEPFDLKKSQTVSIEWDVNQHLSRKDPIEQFVMINAKFDDVEFTLPKYPGQTFNVKPIAVYNPYIETVTVETETPHLVSYLKGYDWVTKTLDVFIEKCDAKNKITNRFDGSKSIPVEETVHKTIRIGLVPTMIFQTVIAYGTRDDIFSVLSKHVTTDVVSQRDCRDYLEGEGASRWQEN